MRVVKDASTRLCAMRWLLMLNYASLSFITVECPPACDDTYCVSVYVCVCVLSIASYVNRCQSVWLRPHTSRSRPGKVGGAFWLLQRYGSRAPVFEAEAKTEYCVN